VEEQILRVSGKEFGNLFPEEGTIQFPGANLSGAPFLTAFRKVMQVKSLGPVVYRKETMRWSKGAIAGNTIYFSGISGADTANGKYPNGIVAQAKLAYERATSYLEEAGSDIDHIVRIVTYIVGRTNIAGYQQERTKWLKRNNAPDPPNFANSVLLVPGLAKKEMLIEIEITAVSR
jgi:enamine deaminase RidA (YjgF/YER057c/UK114 family)